MPRRAPAPPAPVAPVVPPPEDEPGSVIVAQGDAIALPRPPRRTEAHPPTARRAASAKVRPRTHGRRDEDIGGSSDAGDAFAAWLRSKGIDPAQRLPAQQLQSLTAEFKARPVHGHRRTGSSGDNHRANPEHLRKK